MLDITMLVLDGADRGADLPPAGALAARLSGRVVVVPVAGLANGHAAVTGEQLQTRLAAEVDALRAAGVDAELEPTVLARRGAATAIAEAARARGAGLIVVTGAGYRPALGPASPSIAGELLFAAPCPVVSVPAARPRRVAAA